MQVCMKPLTQGHTGSMSRQLLEDQWMSEHKVSLHDDQQTLPDSTSGFNTTTNLKLCGLHGVCVCANRNGKLALIFWRKLTQTLKVYLIKVNKKPSAQRQQFETGGFVLGLRVTNQEQRRLGRLGGLDNLDLEEIYFHVGHTNYRSWDFACIHLRKICFDEESGVTTLSALDSSNQLIVKSAVQFFASVVDFRYGWSLQYYILLSDHVTVESLDMMPSHFLQIKEHLKPYRFWRGAHAETRVRERKPAAAAGTKRTATAKPKAGPRTLRPGPRPGPRPKSRVGNGPSRMEAQEEHDNEYCLLGEVSDDDDDDAAGDHRAEPKIDPTDTELSVGEPTLSELDLLWREMELEMEQLTEAAEDDLEAEEEDESEVWQRLVQEWEAVAAGAAAEDITYDAVNRSASGVDAADDGNDDDPGHELLLKSDPPPQHPAEREQLHDEAIASNPIFGVPEQPPVKRARVESSSQSRAKKIPEEVFIVPSGGEIRFSSRGSFFRAHCPIPSHNVHGACTRQRQATASRRGSIGAGRPLGGLLAWLEDAERCDSKMEHIAQPPQTFTRRQRARNQFKTLPGSDHFLRYERPQDANEGSDEPDEIP